MECVLDMKGNFFPPPMVSERVMFLRGGACISPTPKLDLHNLIVRVIYVVTIVYNLFAGTEE